MGGLMINFRTEQDGACTRVKRGTAARALTFAAPHAWALVFLLTIVILDAGVGIVTPLLYRDIIDNGILKQNPIRVIQFALVTGGLGILSVGLGLAQSYVSAKTSARIVLRLRTKLFEHIQQLPLAFFARTQTGSLVSRLSNDVSGTGNAFTDILSNSVGNLIIVILTAGAMFALSWRITLAAFILPPLIILPARIWGRKLQTITRESYSLSASMNSLMVERFNVAGAQLFKLFGHREKESKVFKANAARVSEIGVKSAVYTRLFFSSLLLMTSVATALAYGWGGTIAAKHILDVGSVVAIVSYLMRLYGPLLGLSTLQVNIALALVSFDRIFEILDIEPMIQDKLGAIEVPGKAARVSFDQVSFRYPSASEVSLASLESIAIPDESLEATVLHDITFTVEPGNMVAIVGPSGAGKTSIAQLLTRLYDVKSGSVKINGIDVRDAKLESLHERIGVVTQDAHFFHDTIRANLLYAKPDATDAQLTEALHAAQILSLIQSLPNGLETLMGERGYRFSGGEKQRLAIARLLLKAPCIVILDEATAHLDSESEAALQKALANALAGKTSIVIAHRLSTVLEADQILVMQDGSIVQRGTHAELSIIPGAYADQCKLQFGQLEPMWTARSFVPMDELV